MDSVTASEFDQFRINVSGNLNQDVIFINASVNVGENFLKGVKRLLGN